MLERNELHNYWKNPTPENQPDKYSSKGLNRRKRSRWLANTMEKYVPLDAKILELGCNVGRNLWYLQKKGYSNLTGIDISADAVHQSETFFPELDAELRVQPLEQGWEGKYDVIYTMAVLVHIHPESEFIFELMDANYIITVEDENTSKERHCARNYHHIFRELGYYQVMEEPVVPGLNQSYIARVLRKDEK